jgi:hypothetical protein
MALDRTRGTAECTSMADADRLFAVPLEDFIAERKRLAKELRDGGDREAAAEVAKLPKPTPPAWALNQLAREEPDAIGAWLDAAEQLRDASAHPSSALREAMAGHREATRTLVNVVRERARPGGKPLSEPMVERVRELLQAATVDPDVGDALRAGRVVEGDEQPALPGLEVRSEAPPPKPRKTRADAAAERRAAKDREAERKEREQAERIAELERLIDAAEEQLGELNAEAEERDAAASAADKRLESAQQALHRAESEAAAARRAATDARDAAATAERELRQLNRQLRHAQ